jgi:quinoprotein glucose dehydrogenase
MHPFQTASRFVSAALCMPLALVAGGTVSETAATSEFLIVPAAAPDQLTPANGWPEIDSYARWTRSNGGPTSNRFSTLSEITPGNVARLEVAWTYRSGDGQGHVQSNPIVVDGALYTATAGHHIVRLDAATGKEVWRYRPEKKANRLEDLPARRGLLHWPGRDRIGPRLFFGAGQWVYALDPETGKPVEEFGSGGRAPLPMGAGVTGVIWDGVLVMPGFEGDVFGYDVVTGKELWRFRTMPQPGEFGYETWQGQSKGANCWGGISLDESRGIAYFSTGSPKPNFVGTGHLGRNLFANCVVALDVRTGARVWHFQEIRHDIWDMDIPAPPNLVTVMRDGRSVDAVAQVTKLGNTLLLDRVTGEPLFPFRLRRAPESTLPGEKAWPYQPDVELPEPFARQEFLREDITDRTPEARAYVESQLARANLGWFEPFELGKPTAFFGVLGGAEWTGAAFDPTTGRLYVNSNHLPYTITVFRDDDPPPAKPATLGEQLYQRMGCIACHGENRRGTAMFPPLRGLRHYLDDAAVISLLKTGRNGMPPAPPMTDAEQQALLDFLFVRDRPLAEPESAGGPVRYAFNGYNRLVDHEGFPGSKPPWGTLNCINLNTGRIDWRIPLGDYPELAAQGLTGMGSINMSGATVTATGLVFVSGTPELWSHALPLHGTAPPTVYEAGGRQYIVIPATGGGKVGGETGDALVAFALPGGR